MKIGYCRRSTDSQEHALQADALRRVGCDRILVETASGTSTERPVLVETLSLLRPGDSLIVYSLSRLARSLKNLIEIGDVLREREVVLVSLTEHIDTGSPSGRFLFAILGAMGQMEVELLRERTRHGLMAARARGRIGGRPRVLDEHKIEIARTLLMNERLSVAEVARQVGCSAPTLYRYLGAGGRRAVVENRAA